MTKRIPNAQSVNRALHALCTELKSSLKGVNKTAGQVMSQGDYSAADAFAAKGREVCECLDQVEELRKRWRVVNGRSAGSHERAGSERTPQWAYYQPILRALRGAGGETRRRDLEPLVERLLASELKPGDRELMARGRERWQVMIHRAQRHLVAEGWIEARAGATWRITADGHKAAEQPSTGATRRS